MQPGQGLGPIVYDLKCLRKSWVNNLSTKIACNVQHLQHEIRPL